MKPKPKPCTQCKHITIVLKKSSNIFRDENGINRPRWISKCNQCGKCIIGDFVDEP